MSNGKHPRSSTIHSSEPRFLNLAPHERHWIRTIPDSYPDIMRAPAVIYKADRDIARVQANKYVAFARPYRGSQGLLIIGKDVRPLIIDEKEVGSPHVLPMRMDREAIQGTWIFAITIYVEGLIQLEDCIVADGRQIRSTLSFKERFALLQKFTDTIWFNDKQFQLFWQIQVAAIVALADVRLAVASAQSGCLCLMPDLPTLRLLKVLPQTMAPLGPVVIGGPREYTCIPIEGKPDVYDLKALDGKNAGRASIQTLSISLALHQKKATGQALKVMAEWNEDFESHVVVSVL